MWLSNVQSTSCITKLDRLHKDMSVVRILNLPCYVNTSTKLSLHFLIVIIWIHLKKILIPIIHTTNLSTSRECDIVCGKSDSYYKMYLGRKFSYCSPVLWYLCIQDICALLCIAFVNTNSILKKVISKQNSINYDCLNILKQYLWAI